MNTEPKVYLGVDAILRMTDRSFESSGYVTVATAECEHGVHCNELCQMCEYLSADEEAQQYDDDWREQHVSRWQR